MKIVVFGLTVSSSWANGHATLWRAMASALARRGHCVTFFERDVPYYASHRDLTVLEGCWFRLYGDWQEAAGEARDQLADADLGLVTSYCPDGAAAAELLLASPARVRAFYDMDTPVTLARRRDGDRVPYLPPDGLGRFDVVFSFTGGAALAALQQELGARRVLPLYGSADPIRHARVPVVPRYACDLSYLGTYAADRQQMLERLFLAPAHALPELRFLIGGAKYPRQFPWLPNVHFARHVPPPEHPGFYSSSRLTLNVTRRPMAAMGHCPSTRLFEAAACGTPILSDWWPGLDEFFVPGREILVARDTGEAIAALRTAPEELARIAAAARARVLAEHSADCRARELEQAFAALTGTPASGSLQEA